MVLRRYQPSVTLVKMPMVVPFSHAHLNPHDQQVLQLDVSHLGSKG